MSHLFSTILVFLALTVAKAFCMRWHHEWDEDRIMACCHATVRSFWPIIVSNCHLPQNWVLGRGRWRGLSIVNIGAWSEILDYVDQIPIMPPHSCSFLLR